MKNLIKRGNRYYFRKITKGKTERISLKTGDKTVAESRVRALVKAANNEQFAIIDAVRSRRTVCTMKEIFEAFLAAAAARGVESAHQYVAQLGNIIKKVHGADFDVENAPSTILTPDLITKYSAAAFTAAGANVLTQERAKITIRSTVINARAVFSRWTSANNVYKDLNLPPTLDAFRKIGLPWKTEAHVYHLPSEELRIKTIKAGRELRQTNPRLYAVFLCCYDLGLRAGEAINLRRDWFSQTVNGSEISIQCDIVRRADFRPKHNMDRHIPLNADTWRELQELFTLPEWNAGGQPCTHVLPGPATARYDLVKREFSAWMRSLGWDGQTYPKAAHELRKLMGSVWYTKVSPQFAQETLGHRNIATTCTFYARLANRPKALSREDAAAVA